MERLSILKTYKNFVGGQFPRSESGRTYPLNNAEGKLIANICLSSKKDLKSAVSAAVKAKGTWTSKSPFLRSQILYRLAEMLEGKKSQLMEELVIMGYERNTAENEIHLSIDRTVYYAGWCDKFQALASSVNPVASSHINITQSEPVGVVGIVADNETALIGLLSSILPCIAGGNTCVALVSEKYPLASLTLAEAINSCDLPAGVVNLLAGNPTELSDTFASHMEINALVLGRKNLPIARMKELGAEDVKRMTVYTSDWVSLEAQGLALITDLQEYKTTWHPMGFLAAGGGSY